MKLRTAGVIVLATMLWSSCMVQAEMIDITGSAPGWSVSAGGAVDVAPQGVMGNGLSITSNDFSTGTPVSGLNLATFDGWWAAYFPFYLPANATKVQLSYFDLTADDRGVLELNGIPIGNAGYQTGLGSMTFTDGGDNVPYEFNGQFTSGSVAAGFILGAPNLLEAIVNNTRTGITGTPQNISPNDGTLFGVYGTITYTVTPEPASLWLLANGLIPFIARRRRCRPCSSLAEACGTNPPVRAPAARKMHLSHIA